MLRVPGRVSGGGGLELGPEDEFVKSGKVFKAEETAEGKAEEGRKPGEFRENRHLRRSLDRIFPAPLYGFSGTHSAEPLKCSCFA